jgi:hypothetical protein
VGDSVRPSIPATSLRICEPRSHHERPASSSAAICAHMPMSGRAVNGGRNDALPSPAAERAFGAPQLEPSSPPLECSEV